MNKFFRILEIVWLVAAIGCAGLSVYFLIIKDSDSALYFIFVFVIAAIMYLLRRHQRKGQDGLNKPPQRIK